MLAASTFAGVVLSPARANRAHVSRHSVNTYFSFVGSLCHVPAWTRPQVSADECAELDEAADRDAEKGGGDAAGDGAPSEAVSGF